MKLKIAAQIDANLNIKTDSTIYLLKEAKRRGHELFCYYTKDLCSSFDKIFAECYAVDITEYGLRLQEHNTVDLDDIDIILMRQDPPFDMRYITATYLLEKCKALVINSPKGVRNFPEKILDYPEFTLPTLIAENLNQIEKFYAQYQDIVLKPLYSFGGRDVVHTDTLEQTLSVAEILIELYGCPIMVQKFFPGIKKGDKRVFLLDGKIIGAFKKISENSFRTNTCLGGQTIKATLTSKEEYICSKVGEDLLRKGILLAGLDIMGECYLAEVNVTSPTGLVAIDNLYGTNVAVSCWDCFESKYKIHCKST